MFTKWRYYRTSPLWAGLPSADMNDRRTGPQVSVRKMPTKMHHALETCARMLSRVRLFVTPGTAARQVLCPWDSPGKITRVGCHFLLQGTFLTPGSTLGLDNFLKYLTCRFWCGWVRSIDRWDSRHTRISSSRLKRTMVPLPLSHFLRAQRAPPVSHDPSSAPIKE